MDEKIWRCGLCNINFKTAGAMRKHFYSDEGHKEKLADPKLMAQKIIESQQSLLIRDMIKVPRKQRIRVIEEVPEKGKGGRR